MNEFFEPFMLILQALPLFLCGYIAVIRKNKMGYKPEIIDWLLEFLIGIVTSILIAGIFNNVWVNNLFIYSQYIACFMAYLIGLSSRFKKEEVN